MGITVIGEAVAFMGKSYSLSDCAGLGEPLGSSGSPLCSVTLVLAATPTEGTSKLRASPALSLSRIRKTTAIPLTFTHSVACDSGGSGGTESDPGDLRKFPEGTGKAGARWDQGK